MKPSSIFKGYKFTAYPTVQQKLLLWQIFGAVRRVYDIGVREQARRFLQHKTDPDTKMLTASKSSTNGIAKPVNAILAGTPDLNWVLEVNSQIRNSKCGTLGEATKAFFRKLKEESAIRRRPRKASLLEKEVGTRLPTNFPRLSRRNDRASFLVPTNVLKIRYEKDVQGLVWGFLRIPTAKGRKENGFELRFRRHRKPRGKPVEATVSVVAGQFYVSLVYEFQLKHTPLHKYPGTSVGVDRNSTDLCGTYDGTQGAVVPAVIDLPHVRQLQKQLKHQQRLLSKMQGVKRGEKKSNRFRKQRQKIQRLHARLTRIRDNHLWVQAHKIASRHEAIFLEDLNIQSMTRSAKGTVEEPGTNVAQKKGLNRSFLGNAPAKFGVRLVQKSTQYGGFLKKVPAPFTSQTCPACEHTEKANRKSQVFKCLKCGFTGHASIVAARNIRSLGLNAESSSSGGLPAVMRVETELSSLSDTSVEETGISVRESRIPNRKARLQGAQRHQDPLLEGSQKVRESKAEILKEATEEDNSYCGDPSGGRS